MSVYIHYPTERDIKVHIIDSDFVGEEYCDRCIKNKIATFTLKENSVWPFEYVDFECQDIIVYIYTSDNVDDVMTFDDFYFELDDHTKYEKRSLLLKIERRNMEGREKIILKDDTYSYKNCIRFYGFTEFEWDEDICEYFLEDIKYHNFKIEFCNEKLELSPYEKIDDDDDDDEGRDEVDIK